MMPPPVGEPVVLAAGEADAIRFQRVYLNGRYLCIERHLLIKIVTRRAHNLIQQIQMPLHRCCCSWRT
ncbi:MAG: hypothetical protein R3E31_09445 [Chloroflexota bacterium]